MGSRSFLYVIVYTLIGTLVLFSCKNSSDEEGAISSTYLQKLAGHTQGVISSKGPIQISFTERVYEVDGPKPTLNKEIIDISPNVAGTWKWEGPSVLRFEVAEGMTPGQHYTVRLDMARLYTGLSKDSSQYTFSFDVLYQDFQWSVGNLRPDEEDSRKQILSGTILLADVAPADQVKAMLSLKPGNSSQQIEWFHAASGLRHGFEIQGIPRQDEGYELLLSIDGAPIEVDRNDQVRRAVPAVGEFQLLDASVPSEDRNSFTLTFSDPLDPDQEFAGLVQLMKYSADLRFQVDKNQLRVYTSGNTSGAYQLRIDPAIRSALGASLGALYERSLAFEDIKPTVKLTGSGVIIPGTEKIHFPFEAVNLTAVQVEIYKVFTNNISQFYQNSDLDNTWYNNQVGRVIHRERVLLNQLNPEENINKWVRYGLDLSRFIDDGPNAIYQVSIGFYPEDAILNCAANWSNFGYNPTTTTEPDQSIWRNYYGPAGYYENYVWSDRNDPCKPAYYNPDRFVRRNVFRSRLALIAKVSNQGKYGCIVTDLTTAQPMSGVKVKLLDFQQQLIGEATTDGDGQAWINAEEEGFLFVATKGSEKGYLRVMNESPLSLSEFDVDGVTVRDGLKGFLYTERGVWRPGDSIYLNLILRNQAQKLPRNYPVTLKLFDPRNRLHTSFTVSNAIDGHYGLHCSTSAEDPTGTWRVVVETGATSFVKYLMIETVKPNRLKIEIDPGKKAFGYSENQIAGDIQANWLHGAPASDLKARIEMQIKPAQIDFEGFSDFRFDDPMKSNPTATSIIFDEALDENGKAIFRSDPVDTRSLAGVSNVVLKTRVFEKGGNESTDQFTWPYYPFSNYAGIKIPLDRYRSKRLQIGTDTALPILVVDDTGTPSGRREVEITLYKLDWKWWYERDLSRNSAFNIRSHADLIETTRLTTDANGKVAYVVNPSDYGRYFVRVCDTGSGHCSGDFFYSGYPWYRSDYGKKDAASVLSFAAEKEVYAVGEEAALLVPSAEGCRIFVSLENGSTVIRTFWVDGAKDETRVTFKTTSDMMPGVYAHVHLIQPHGQEANDLPIRLYGVQHIKIEDPATHLKPEINMPGSLEPEQKFTLRVGEEHGRSMVYTLAIVDEGLLSLTRYEAPDPWNHFYAKEALGVKTWDIYNYVMGAKEGHFDRVVSIGGDAARLDAPDDERANRFKPVVMHVGPFFLEKGKTALHEFTMPNYIGSVRAMVVASSGDAYGKTEQEVKVKKPVMVLATAPRVLNPGNKVRIPVNVFVMEKGIRQVNVQLDASSDLIDVTSGSRREVTFSKPDEQMVYFDIDVKERTGVAKILVEANGGGEKVSQEIELQIVNPNPHETSIQDKVLAAGESWSASVEPLGMPGTNAAVLEISDIPSLKLEDQLNYLIRYPYGCIEQTTSAVFAQLFLNDLMELPVQKRDNIQTNIQAGIRRLQRFQSSNGGFVYWPGNSQVNPWATSYVGHFLLEARERGYYVPANLLDQWITYQKRAVSDWSMDNYAAGWTARSKVLDQAYRLYSLALAGSPELGAMNRLRNIKELNSTARARLAAAYTLSGRPEAARVLIEEMNHNVSPYQELSYTYGSHFRDMSMILESLVDMEDEEKAFIVLKDLVEGLNSRKYWSTQTLAYALLGVAKYVGIEQSGNGMNFTCRISGQSPVNVETDKRVFQISLPVDDQPNLSVSIENTSAKRLFTQVVVDGQPLTGTEKTQSSDLDMQITYLNLEGQPLDITQLPQGIDFVAKVRLRHPGTRRINYREMALAQVFPPGWEIINTRMDKISRFPLSSSLNFQDFRDDRVHTHFDLPPDQQKTFYFMLNAAYEGTYYLPGVRCEAMYDNTIYAQQAGREVSVIKPIGN